jgi:secretion/DNA translocation related TadE-like protein
MTGARRDDCGSATVLVLAGVLACCVVGGLWVTSGRAALARQRAETAADLAALAGAQSLARLEAAPCAAAGAVAGANGGQLVSCSIAGAAVTVTVSVRRPMPAHAKARAGPERTQ